jgi:protoporphyrinogen oxidase
MLSSNFEYFGDKWISQLNLNALDKETEKFAKKAVNNMKKAMDAHLSEGNVYTRYKNGEKKTVISSLPGFPPNTNFGDLRDSLGYMKVGQSKYEIYSLSSYASFLEFGAPGNNLLPRPFFEPYIKKAFNQYLAELSIRFQKQLAEGKKVYGYNGF